MTEEFQGDSVWRMVENTPRPSIVVEYPRKDPIKGFTFGKIRMQLLSQEEQTHAITLAEKHAKEDAKLSSGPSYEDLYKSHLSLEIVQRASFSEEKYQDTGKLSIMFPPVKLMKMRMTDDELSYLITAYLNLQATKGAIRHVFNEGELEILPFMLLQNPEEILAGMSHDAMVNLLIAFAKKIEEFNDVSTQ
jgi:hypothetical protein